MKSFEYKRNSSQTSSIRDRSKAEYSDNISVEMDKINFFYSKNRKTPSQNKKHSEIYRENYDKNIENFAKLSEMLADAQGDILTIFEMNSDKSVGKNKLWEIFTYLNNRIWTAFFKNSNADVRESEDMTNMKKKLSNATFEMESLKFQLAEYAKNNLPAEFEKYEEEIGSLKSKVKEYIQELNELSQQNTSHECKIHSLLEENSKLKYENSDLINTKTKELSIMNIKLSEITRDRELLLDIKNKSQTLTDQMEKQVSQKLLLERENKHLREQLITTKSNFEKIEDDYISLQNKYLKQTQQYEVLTVLNKDLQDELRVRPKSRTSGSSKSMIRSSIASPQVEKSLKKKKFSSKVQLSIEKFSNIFIPPLINCTGIIEMQEMTIKLIGDELNIKNLEIVRLENDLNSKTQELNKRNMDLSNKKNEISKLENDLKSVINSANEAFEQCPNIQIQEKKSIFSAGQRDVQVVNLESYKKIIETLSKTITNLHKELETANSLIKSFSENNEYQIKKIENLEKILENAGQQKKGLEKNVEGLKSELATLANSVKAYENSRKSPTPHRVVLENKDAAEKASVLQDKIQKIGVLNQKNKELSMKNMELERKIEEISNAKDQMAEVIRKNTDFAININDLSNKNKEITIKNQELEGQIKELLSEKGQKSGLLKKNTELLIDINELNEKLILSQEKEQKACENNFNLSQDLQKANKELAITKNELGKAKISLQKAFQECKNDEYAKKITEMECKIREYIKKYDIYRIEDLECIVNEKNEEICTEKEENKRKCGKMVENELKFLGLMEKIEGYEKDFAENRENEKKILEITEEIEVLRGSREELVKAEGKVLELLRKIDIVNKDLKNKTIEIKEKEFVIDEKCCLLKEKDLIIEGINKALEEKALIIEKKDNVLKEKDLIIKTKVNTLEEKDKLLKEKDSIIEKKDNLLTEKDSTIEKKVNLLTEKDSIIKEKIETYNHLLLSSQQSTSKSQEIHSKALQSLNSDLSSLKTQLQNTENSLKSQITTLNQQLNSKNSQLTSQEQAYSLSLTNYEKQISDLIKTTQNQSSIISEKDQIIASISQNTSSEILMKDIKDKEEALKQKDQQFSDFVKNTEKKAREIYEKFIQDTRDKDLALMQKDVTICQNNKEWERKIKEVQDKFLKEIKEKDNIIGLKEAHLCESEKNMDKKVKEAMEKYEKMIREKDGLITEKDYYFNDFAKEQEKKSKELHEKFYKELKEKDALLNQREMFYLNEVQEMEKKALAEVSKLENDLKNKEKVIKDMLQKSHGVMGIEKNNMFLIKGKKMQLATNDQASETCVEEQKNIVLVKFEGIKIIRTDVEENCDLEASSKSLLSLTNLLEPSSPIPDPSFHLLETENSRLKSDLQSQQTLLEDFSNTIEEMGKKLENLSKTNSELLIELSEQKSENVSLTGKIGDFSKQILSLQLEKQDILDNFSGDLTNRTGKVLRNEMSKLENKFQEYEEHIELLKDEKDYQEFIGEQIEEANKRLAQENIDLKNKVKSCLVLIKKVILQREKQEIEVMTKADIIENTDKEELVKELLKIRKCIMENYCKKTKIGKTGKKLKENLISSRLPVYGSN